MARRLGRDLGVEVRTTLLGAHALPPEYAGRSSDYIALVCQQMLPALAAEGLVDAVDVFCERIGFSLAETEAVFNAAQGLGLPVKLHAEQLSDSGGAQLAAGFQHAVRDVGPQALVHRAGAQHGEREVAQERRLGTHLGVADVLPCLEHVAGLGRALPVGNAGCDSIGQHTARCGSICPGARPDERAWPGSRK